MGKNAPINWKKSEELIPLTKKKSQPTKRYTPCYEQSDTLASKLCWPPLHTGFFSRHTIQNSTFKVKCIMFPNHGLNWNIEVPLKSITCNNVPCSNTQHHKNYTYIQEQILEHFSDSVSSASQMRNITAKWRYFCMMFKPILPRWTLVIVG
jgi:hypothetical protein